MKFASAPLVALMGNPNCGKTALFNSLTGLNQKVSNYPGVTVEKKTGTALFKDGLQFRVLDLPGTYSLTPESMDERIVAEQVLHWVQGQDTPQVIVSVVDVTNMSRNLFLTTQITDLGLPVVVALNMMDLLDEELKLDLQQLANDLGVQAIIPVSAVKQWGIPKLLSAIQSAGQTKNSNQPFPLELNPELTAILAPVKSAFTNRWQMNDRLATANALRLITRQSPLQIFLNLHDNALDAGQLSKLRQAAVDQMEAAGYKHRILEATLRYEWIDRILSASKMDIDRHVHQVSHSERVDRLLTHNLGGPFIFIMLLYFIFQSIFSWATIPMDWINHGIARLGGWVLLQMNAGMLRDLLVEGVIAGVGAILTFLPQIMILMFFMVILEDTGYMARVAFMMDRFMTKIGLHGRSVLPLMSGYACAIPGIMSTRTIDSWKERLVTILILPLMSCSARLPVYSLMIGAFIPAGKALGFLNMQGLTLVIMYFLGTATAFILAKVFSRFIPAQGKSSFVMELPPYRMPLWRSVFHQVFNRGKLFVLNAGKIIMAISIVLWFLASYPKTDGLESHVQPIEKSFAGQIGQTLEPLIAPLGFDWKIGIGLITSFAAREVLVSTMATIYNVQSETGDVVQLKDALRKDSDPETGLPLYSPLMAVSLMVFFVFAAQCMATFAIVKNETNSWKWPLFMILYMNGLAYGAALLVYQGGQLLGFA